MLRLRPSARRATSSCSVEQMVAQAAGQHEATPSSITLTHAHTRTGASTSKPLRLALFNRGSFASMREMISSAAMSGQRGRGSARSEENEHRGALPPPQQHSSQHEHEHAASALVNQDHVSRSPSRRRFAYSNARYIVVALHRSRGTCTTKAGACRSLARALSLSQTPLRRKERRKRQVEPKTIKRAGVRQALRNLSGSAGQHVETKPRPHGQTHTREPTQHCWFVARLPGRSLLRA